MGSNVCETKWLTLEEGELFKCLGSQVAATGGCKRDVVPESMTDICTE